MNTNASRFSHVVSLDFDQAGQVASASIQVTSKLQLRVQLLFDTQSERMKICLQDKLYLQLRLTVSPPADDAAGEAESEQTT